MKKIINVGVVGVGFVGKQHIEAIRRIPRTKIVGIVQSDFDKAKALAEVYDIDYFYDDLNDLLDLEGLDVVHICTPNYLHYDMAKKVIMAGVNVFCEKPLSLTSEEALELSELAEEYNVKSAVNLNYRGNVMVKEMRERVKNEVIGKTLMGQAQYVQDWLMFDTDYDWHFNPELVGPSRAVADIGTHLFDLIQYVYDKKIVKVFCEMVIAYPYRKEREQFGETFALEYGEVIAEQEVVNEDAAFLIVELEGGTKVSMDVSQVTGGYKNAVELVVSGSKSSLTWNQEVADKLIVGNREGGNEVIYADPKYVSPAVRDYISLPNGHAVGWADAFKNSIATFYESFTKDINENVDFNEGYYLMKLVEAAILSNKEKRWVIVEDI